MATGRIIGQIEVASGDITIIGTDGVTRAPKYGDYVYEGEQVVSNDPGALFQVKYSALPEATAYDGVFKILADGSLVAGMDTMDSVSSSEDLADVLETAVAEEPQEDVFDLETAAGEESADGNSAYIPTEIVAESSVQDFGRGPNPSVSTLPGVEIGEDMTVGEAEALADVITTVDEDVNNRPVAGDDDITKIADHEIISMGVEAMLEGTSVYEKNGWYGIRDDSDGEHAAGNPLVDSHGSDEGIIFTFTNDVSEATIEFKNVGDNPQDNDNILIELYNDGEKLDVTVDTSGIENFTPFTVNEGVSFDEIRIVALDPVSGNGNRPTEFRVSSVVDADLERDWVLPFIIDDNMLLANDSDIDSDALHIELVDGNLYASDGTTVIGSVEIITDASSDNFGDIQITPDPIEDFDTHAPDYANFSYVVVDEDGASSDPATATINVAIGDVSAPEISYDQTTGEFIIGTDSNIEAPDVLYDNILTVYDSVDLSHVADINTIELGSNATVLGSSDSGGINPTDVINATDVDNVLVIHSASDDDASAQVDVNESFGTASQVWGDSGADLGVDGTYYNQYIADGATLLIEIEPPLEVD